MKNTRKHKRLSLSRDTLRHLTTPQLGRAAGGSSFCAPEVTDGPECGTDSDVCTLDCPDVNLTGLILQIGQMTWKRF